MQKKNLVIVVLLSICAIVALCITLILGLENSKTETVFKISKSGDAQESYVMKELNLKPGEEKVQTIQLKSERNGKFVITIDFEETKVGTLKNFVNVIIEANGKKEERKFVDLLDGDEKIEFTYQLKTKKSQELTIRYQMTLEVENEAQGATADFVINLSAVQID